MLLAKLNCNDNRKFCEEAMAVDRFPTIRAFANGGADMENYEHNLDADAILAYVGHAMQARLDPPCSTMIHHAPPCSTMIHHDPPCPTVTHRDPP